MEEQRYNQRVPTHIEDTETNHQKWLRYRNVISQVELVGDSLQSERFHLYPELVLIDTANARYINICDDSVRLITVLNYQL